MLVLETLDKTQSIKIHKTRLKNMSHISSPYICSSPFYIFKNFFALTFLKPTGHVMHQQFNIQQLYTLPTLYLCVLYLSENKQRLVPLTA